MYIVRDIMESTVHYTTHPGIMTLKLSMAVVAVMWSIISPYLRIMVYYIKFTWIH